MFRHEWLQWLWNLGRWCSTRLDSRASHIHYWALPGGCWGMIMLSNFGPCWPISGIQGQWFLICKLWEVQLFHHGVFSSRGYVWHVLWAATKIGLLENVLGFRSVLSIVLAIIKRNIPGSLYWIWDLVIGFYWKLVKDCEGFQLISTTILWGMPLRAWLWTRIPVCTYTKCSLTCFGLFVI